MSKTEFDCVLKGKSVVETIAKTGSNCIAFGEMVWEYINCFGFDEYYYTNPSRSMRRKGTGVSDKVK
jgi:nicotinate-nucleotide--dimethylbenzimidazole phosphoribosyltransferase